MLESSTIITVCLKIVKLEIFKKRSYFFIDGTLSLEAICYFATTIYVFLNRCNCCTSGSDAVV